MTPRRVAIRLAVSLLRATPLRSLLLVVAIATPVAIGVGVSTLTRTAIPSPEGFVEQVMGNADLRVRDASASDTSATDEADDGGLLERDRRVRTMVPDDAEVQGDVDVYGATLSVEGSSRTLNGRVTDLTGGVLTPIFGLVEGEWSSRASSITLSRGLAEALEIDLGDELVVEGLGARQVTAIVVSPSDLDAVYFVLPWEPTTLEKLSDVRRDGPGGLDVGVPRWAIQVSDPGVVRTALGAAGYDVESRAELLQLAPRSPLADPAGVGLAVLLLVEVGIFAAAGLAISFDGHRRQIALLTCLGASERTCRRYLLGYCGLTGLLGGIVGSGVGLLGSAAVAPVFAARAGQQWGPLQPSWTALLALLAVAIVVAVLAGLWPTRSLVRRTIDEPGSAVAPVPGRLSGWTTTINATAVATAVFVLWRISRAGGDMIALALLASVLGLVASVGLLTALLSTYSRRAFGAPLLVRVALRSMVASPQRTWVVLCGSAAIAAAVTTLLLPFTSAVHNSADTHIEQAPSGAALVATPRELSDGELDEMVSSLGLDRAARFSYASAEVEGFPHQLRVLTDLLLCAEQTDEPTACASELDDDALQAWLGLADEGDLARFVGRDLSSAELDAYVDGAVATVASQLAQQETVELTYLEFDEDGRMTYPTLLTLSAVTLAEMPGTAETPVALLHPDAAERHGITPRQGQDLLRDGAPYELPAIALLIPAADTVLGESAVISALPSELQATQLVLVEQGAQFREALPRILGLVVAVTVATTTGALLVAIALWVVTARDGYRMLGALGASRRWRRMIGALNGFVLAIVSMVAAVTWGIATAAVFLQTQDVPLIVPWLPLLYIVLLVTALAPTIGALVVPTKEQPLRTAEG